MVFTDLKGRIIGYGEVELTGVYEDGDENESPLNILSENDLGYPEDQEKVHPDQEEQPIIQ